MPRIISVGTAVPQYKFDQPAVKEFVRKMFKEKYHATERLLSVFDNSDIKQRYFCVPLEWFGQEHSFAEKNALYIKHAVELSVQAIENCLKKTDFNTNDIDKIIFVSSTGISTPSIDALIINKLPFKHHVKRTPIWGLGCAGGAVGISRAHDYTTAYPNEKVIFVAVELCGITFQHQDFTKSNYIATALFGEGAAAVLVVGDNVKTSEDNVYPNTISTLSAIWQDTLDIMGWKVEEEGLKVIFSKDIPSFVKKNTRRNVEDLLSEKGLRLEDIKHFVIHPGGVKVIKAYQEALNISNSQHEIEVINNYGNMSSPTIIFVLEKIMQEGMSGDYGIMAALGPGFSSELLLLQWQ